MEKTSQKEILKARSSLHPRAAVVIPFFNQIDKLRRTAESLIDQVLRPALVVFVDDNGSERMDPDILRSMEEAGIMTILVLNERNLGPGGSRQAGFKQVPEDVDYVLFLDSDDHLSEQFLSSSVKMHMERPDVIATYGDSVYQATGASRLGPSPFPSCLLDGMVRSRPWGTGAFLWKRSLIKDVEWKSWKNFEDSHFELSAAMVNPRIAFVPGAVLYVDQVFTMERMRLRNRMFEKNDIIAHRSKIFESILMDFPFRRHGLDSGDYVRQSAYYVSRLFPEGPGAYLSMVVRLALHGRLQAALQTASRFPHYLQSRRPRKG
jgi:glycosyltransferase involved in cell wall biosynthesis